MAWDHEGSRHERGYGYEWTKTRERILHRDLYLCQPCLARGRPTQATAVDHIIPKAFDGADDHDNLQSICDACHRAKTKIESSRRNRSRKTVFDVNGWPVWGDEAKPRYSIPDHVQPSAIPVILVCGPPASGKTTYAMNNAGPSDIIIDLDAYKVRVGGVSWDTRADIWRKAYAMRDAVIRSLSSRRKGRAFLIVGAATAAERKLWCETLGDVDVVVQKTPEDECIRRIKADQSRSHAADGLIKAVSEWFLHN